MTEQTKQRIRFWYGIFLSVFTVAVGVLFLAEVADIYFAKGEFTRNILGERLLKHALAPFILWVLAVAMGFALSVAYPVAEQKRRKPNAQKSLSRMRGKLPQTAEGLSEELQADFAKVKKFELVRIVLWSVSAAVCLASAIATFVYVFNKAHFSSSDYNACMLDMAKFVLPFVCVSFACCVATAIYEAVSAKKELPLVKKLVAATAVNGTKAEEKKSKLPVWVQKLQAFCAKNENRILWGVRVAVLVVAIVFIAVGIANGGVHDVLIKAINICRECIGLG